MKRDREVEDKVAKKAKKKAKKAKKAAAAAAAALEAEQAEAKAEKKAKKKAKKAKKAAAAAAAAAGGDDAPAKKTKKTTQDKAAAAAAESGASAPPSLVDKTQAAAFRESNKLTLHGRGCDDFVPMLLMEEARARMPALAMKTCEGFEKPTAIQAQCWPIALSGRDIVGVAETGSGKTLAFLLPCVRGLQERRAAGAAVGGPGMLVLAPTRELAMQTAAVAIQLSPEISSICVFGGVDKRPQRKALRNAVDIIIATPGRLLDLVVNEECCSLGTVKFVILDEADRMLDMGFEKDMRQILALVGKGTHQTLMFSATWPQEIRKLAGEFLTDPIRVTIGDDDLTANVRVKQCVEVIDAASHIREARLKVVIQKLSPVATCAGGVASKDVHRTLVFVLYKKEAPRIERILSGMGYSCAAIHGDKSQDQRIAALSSFKDGSCAVLVATDVAARGLDIPGVETVINFSFPLTIEDYIHRIGRTGRAGKFGVSHTFFTTNDKARAGELVNVMRTAAQKVPKEMMRFDMTVKKKAHGMYGSHFNKDMDPNAKATKKRFS
jgi:ATP-dependent RNA helicase DBP3